MAPAATEDTQIEALPSYVGQYKEQSAGPKSYGKRVEERGSESQPKAAVRRLSLVSMLITHSL